MTTTYSVYRMTTDNQPIEVARFQFAGQARESAQRLHAARRDGDAGWFEVHTTEI